MKCSKFSIDFDFDLLLSNFEFSNTHPTLKEFSLWILLHSQLHLLELPIHRCKYMNVQKNPCELGALAQWLLKFNMKNVEYNILQDKIMKVLINKPIFDVIWII